MYQNRTKSLVRMHPGDEGFVFLVLAKGKVRQRLLEMGFVRGIHLRVEKNAPMGDPMELVIKEYHISLRKDDSQCIIISDCNVV